MSPAESWLFVLLTVSLAIDAGVRIVDRFLPRRAKPRPIPSFEGRIFVEAADVGWTVNVIDSEVVLGTVARFVERETANAFAEGWMNGMAYAVRRTEEST